MTIKVVKGIGEGKTELSAFDGALKDAGVYNYNLVQLSSVIPPGSKVEVSDAYETPEGEWGHKLYIVKAEMRSNEAKKFIAAGVGWYQLDDGRGLFVEHEIIGDTDIAVKSEIKYRISSSLKDLCNFRGIEFHDNKMKSVISVTRVGAKPACALVLAVFESEGWKS